MIANRKYLERAKVAENEAQFLIDGMATGDPQDNARRIRDLIQAEIALAVQIVYGEGAAGMYREIRADLAIHFQKRPEPWPPKIDVGP